MGGGPRGKGSSQPPKMYGRFGGYSQPQPGPTGGSGGRGKKAGRTPPQPPPPLQGRDRYNMQSIMNRFQQQGSGGTQAPSLPFRSDVASGAYTPPQQMAQRYPSYRGGPRGGPVNPQRIMANSLRRRNM
jgi:hypothetical protein